MAPAYSHILPGIHTGHTLLWRRGLKIVAIIVHKGVHIVVVVHIVVKAENLVGAITVARTHAIKRGCGRRCGGCGGGGRQGIGGGGGGV